jgi:hypothetical protein
VHITCPTCGRRNSLERRLREPETVDIICHGCEALATAHYPGETSPELSGLSGREPETTL